MAKLKTEVWSWGSRLPVGISEPAWEWHQYSSWWHWFSCPRLHTIYHTGPYDWGWSDPEASPGGRNR